MMVGFTDLLMPLLHFIANLQWSNILIWTYFYTDTVEDRHMNICVYERIIYAILHKIALCFEEIHASVYLTYIYIMKFVIYFTDRKYSLSEEMKRRLKHTPWDESNKYRERTGRGTWSLYMYTFTWFNRTIFLYYMTYLYVFSWWTLMDFALCLWMYI